VHCFEHFGLTTQLTIASRRAISPSSVFFVVFGYWTPWSAGVVLCCALVINFALIAERKIAWIPQGNTRVRDWNECNKRIKQWDPFPQISISHSSTSRTKILTYHPSHVGLEVQAHLHNFRFVKNVEKISKKLGAEDSKFFNNKPLRRPLTCAIQFSTKFLKDSKYTYQFDSHAG